MNDSPRASALLIPSLSAANFAIGMGAFVVIGILSPIATDLKMTNAEAGWVMTGYAIAYLSSPIMVALTGRVERRLLLAAGLAVFALASVIAALASDPATLFAARVLAAFGAGLVTPTAAAVAAAASTPEKRGKALAMAFMGLTLAQVLGVPIGAWIGYTYGWSYAFLMTAALAIAAMVTVLIIVPHRLPFQATSLKALGTALTHMKTLLAIAFTALIMAAIYVLYTYISPLLEARMEFDRTGISLFLLTFGVGAVFGNLIGGWLTDRIGATKTLMVVCTAQFAFLPVFSNLPIADWTLYAVAFVWSVGGWCFAASQQARLIALAPDRANVMLALNAAAIYVGVSLGAFVGGGVLERFGFDALGYTGACIAALALLTLVFTERFGD
jgi:DHA1 family inner membrane transport protein